MQVSKHEKPEVLDRLLCLRRLLSHKKSVAPKPTEICHLNSVFILVN